MNAAVIDFHVAQRDFQMVFQGVEAIEDFVAERLLPQVIPEVFNGIEFRGVRWQLEETQIGGQL
jgi:hypothetical protein